MTEGPIKILLADDTLIAREGWKSILETIDGVDVVGEVATAQDTLAQVEQLQPDVVLMDLFWFGDKTAGETAIHQIKRKSPHTKIIAITAYPDLIAGARKAGADAALTKGFSRQELIEHIRAVHGVAGFPVPATQEPEPPEELTDREREVLALMAAGLTYREIARKLDIAESTAKKHAGSILGKLEAPNRARAVAIGFEKGILGGDSP
jgi:DNA-binding NarL/FixJ family response regulator